MSDTIHANGSWVGDSIEEFKKLPPAGKIAVGGGAILLLVIAVYIFYKRQSSSTSAANTAAPGQATTLPATQNPPVTNAAASLVPTPAATPAATPTGLEQPGIPLTPFSPSGWIAQLRSKFSNSDTNAWDSSVGNIPIRSTPGGAIVGQIGYGQTIGVSGPAITGPSNLPAGDTNGSNVWYSIPGQGYISGYDVTGTQPSPIASSGQGNGSAGGLTSYTLRRGDNLNEVASKLGLRGGWQSLVGPNPGPLVAGQAIQVPSQ